MASVPLAGGPVASLGGRGSLHEAVEAVLQRLRHEGRRAIRIADLDCGSGRRLVRVARRARALGFVAVEARGCARTRAEAAAAAKAASGRNDAAIGLSFDAIDPDAALAEEVEQGADLVIAADERLPDVQGRPDAPILLAHRVHAR